MIILHSLPIFLLSFDYLTAVFLLSFVSLIVWRLFSL